MGGSNDSDIVQHIVQGLIAFGIGITSRGVCQQQDGVFKPSGWVGSPLPNPLPTSFYPMPARFTRNSQWTNEVCKIHAAGENRGLGGTISYCTNTLEPRLVSFVPPTHIDLFLGNVVLADDESLLLRRPGELLVKPTHPKFVTCDGGKEDDTATQKSAKCLEELWSARPQVRAPDIGQATQTIDQSHT